MLGSLCLPEAAWADPQADARRHWKAGVAAAQAGDFALARTEFTEAEALFPHPAATANIALAAGDLGLDAEALEAAERYLARCETAEWKANPACTEDYRRRIEELQANIAVRQNKVVDRGESAPRVAKGELARLGEIAAELEALRKRLESQGPGEAPQQSPQEGERPSEPTETPAVDYLEEAYARVVVTASRTSQDPLDSPSTVVILTEDDIRLSGVTNIPDLLRQVAGVDVMQLAAGQPDLAIRGFNRELSNKVLVLIDGRSVYQDMLATPFWGTLPISMQDIARVEVIRGPGSAVYGANAMTGVVNIITKTPGEGKNEVHVEGGRPGYLQGSASVTGRSGPNAWRLSAGTQRMGRWADLAPGTTESLEVAVADPERSLDVVRAYGRVDRVIGKKGFLGLSGGYAEGMQEFYAIGALGDYALPFRSGFARVDASYEPVHLRSFYNRFDGEAFPWLQPVGGRSLATAVSNDVFDVELEAIEAFKTGQVSHQLNVGTGYRYKSVRWGYLQGQGEEAIVEHHTRAFVNEQATLGRWSAVGSFRVDRHPLVDLSKTLSPRGALIVRTTGGSSVRVSSGTSFRAPSQMESYLELAQPVDVDGGYVRTLGSKELVPERIFTVEAGYHQADFDWLEADVVTYWNRVTELIYLQDIEPVFEPLDSAAAGFALGETSFGNLSPVWSALGTEAQARFFPIDGLDLYLNGTWQRVIESDGSLELRDEQTSTWKVNAGVLWRSPWHVDLSGHIQHLSPQVWRLRSYDSTGQLIVEAEGIPARTIGVARAGVSLKDDTLELAISAWNIGALISGEGVREHPKGQPVGGTLFGSASYRF